MWCVGVDFIIIITSPGFVYGGVDNIGNSGFGVGSSLNDKCVLKSRPFLFFLSVGSSLLPVGLVSGRVCVSVVGE